MFTAVVFPAPFGPRRARITPSGTTRSIPARAVTSLYRLTRPCASIMFAIWILLLASFVAWTLQHAATPSRHSLIPDGR